MRLTWLLMRMLVPNKNLSSNKRQRTLLRNDEFARKDNPTTHGIRLMLIPSKGAISEIINHAKHLT